MKSQELSPIGFIRSPFREKFGVPRQSSMIEEAVGLLKLNPEPSFQDAVRSLENFSHVWILFLFDRNSEGDWRPTVQLPRLEVEQRVGVFASRSPHRPNRLGMSAVKMGSIHRDAPGGIEIELQGLDILDGTAVVDLKPYVPYTDCIPSARAGWTEPAISRVQVSLDAEAEVEILAAGPRNTDRFRGDPLAFVIRMLELDPRPTSQREAMPLNDPLNEGRRFACRILDLDVHWEIRSGGIRVVEVRRLPQK